MSGRHDFDRPEPCRLLRALVEAHDGVMRADERQIRSYGLSHGEFDCLATLGEDGQPLRMCDLAERSLLTKSHATHIVKQLEAKGLIQRRRSPESEREVLVSLTPGGQELFERVHPIHSEYLRRLLDGRMNEQEQEELTTLLRKLAAGW